MNSPRILTLDIETKPLEVYAWGTWEQNIGLDMIKADWSILAYCAKWLDDPKLIYQDTGGRGSKRVRDDSKLLRGIRDLLHEADIVVVQNGKKFDLRKINARLIQRGIDPYSPIRVIDTCTVARKHFGFTSNKLAWTSSLLTDTPKDDHKSFPGFSLWKECLQDNPKAWAEMKKYNQRDVVATEKLYLKLRPWIDNHPNVSTYGPRTGKSGYTCPKCGSAKVQARGWAHTQAGVYPRIQCHSCGGWSTMKKNALTPEQRASLLKN